MKKLYLFLAAMIVCLTAHAVDYYMIGEFNGWTEKQANCKMTAESDGTYTLNVAKLVSGFKINDGTWTNPAQNWGAPGDAVLNPGVPYTLTASGDSKNISLANEILNAHVVFNPTAKTVTVTGTENNEHEITYAIRGTITGDQNWADIPMTEENGKWVLSTNVVAGNFGIKKMDNGTQINWIYAPTASATIGTAQVGSPITCILEGTSSGQNFASSLVGSYTFTFDPEALTLTVTEAAPIEDVITYGIHGQIFNGSSWSSTDMTEEDGKWVLKANVVPGEFGIKKMNNGTQTDWYSSASAVVTINESDLDKPLAAKVNGTNWKSNLEGEFTFTFDPEALTLTVTGEGVTPIDPVYTYMLHNNIIGDWASTEFEEVEGKLSITADCTPGEFGVRVIKDGDTANAVWYAAPKTGDAEIIEATLGSALPLATDCVNYKFTLNGNFTFVLDPEAMTVTITRNGDIPPVGEDVITYALSGQFAESTEWSDVALTGEGTTLTATATVLAEAQFGVKELTNGKQSTWYAAAAADAVIGTEQLDKAISLVSTNTVNFTLTNAGEYTFTVDTEAKTIIISKVDGPIPPVEDEFTYFLHNNVLGDWASTPFELKEGALSITGDGTPGEMLVKVVKNGDETTADWYGVAAATTVTEDSLGTAITLTTVDKQNIKFDLNGNFTFALDAENMTLTVTRNGEIPPVGEDVITYALHGQFNESEEWSDLALTGEGTTLTASTKVLAESKFGMKEMTNDKQTNWYAASAADAVIGAEQLGKTINLTDNDLVNFTLTDAGEYTFTVDTEAMTIVITKADGPIPPVEDDYTYFLHNNVIGDWASTPFELKDGKLTITADGTPGEMLVKAVPAEEGAEAEWYGVAAATTVTEESLGTAITLTTVDKQNIKFDLSGNFTFTLDAENMTLTVTRNGEIPPVGEDVITYALRGQFNESEEWSDVELSGEGVLKAEVKVLANSAFGMKKMINDKQTNWYAAPTGSATIGADQLGQTLTLTDTNCENYVFAEAGEYVITIDTTAMTMVVTSNNSVKGVQMNDGIIVAGGVINVPGKDFSVFTTAGALVARNGAANVAPGIYIVVVEGQASKVVVK